MKPEYITLIAALGGATIGILSSIITTIITKYYESKMAYRHLLVDAAIKNWQGAKDVALAQGGKLYPLDSYILANAKMMQLIADNKLDDKSIKAAIKDVKQINDIYKENRKIKK